MISIEADIKSTLIGHTSGQLVKPKKITLLFSLRSSLDKINPSSFSKLKLLLIWFDALSSESSLEIPQPAITAVRIIKI